MKQWGTSDSRKLPGSFLDHKAKPLSERACISVRARAYLMTKQSKPDQEMSEPVQAARLLAC